MNTAFEIYKLFWVSSWLLLTDQYIYLGFLQTKFFTFRAMLYFFQPHMSETILILFSCTVNKSQSDTMCTVIVVSVVSSVCITGVQNVPKYIMTTEAAVPPEASWETFSPANLPYIAKMPGDVNITQEEIFLPAYRVSNIVSSNLKAAPQLLNHINLHL